MQIFVSYARVDKPYCVQIVEMLDFHDVWYDQRLYAGQKWWKEILNRLEWCDGFVYLISRDSLDSEYCQREFEIAQSLGKHIFPLIIDPEVTLPETISHIQSADLSKGLTTETVRDLLRAIYIAEQSTWRQHAIETPPAPPPAPLDDQEINRFVSEAAQAMEKGEYDRAAMLWNQILASDRRPRFIDVEKLAAEAEAALERQMERRQMERDYRQIVELVHLPATRNAGLQAFEAFSKDYPHYDPDNLSALLVKARASHPVNAVERANERTRRFPMLEWCEIPAGKVRVAGSMASRVKQIDTFLMARYPVTNKQYQIFLNAPNGYVNPQWWDYAESARQWRAANPKPRLSKFEGHDRPRESVTWYDAKAFSLWISDLLKLEITLPTLQQRQRAIMGDDERIFPWGNTFEQTRCNTRESELRLTTVVNRYPDGVSQYGVYDLAGNVWEWCADVTTAEKPAEDAQVETPQEKAVVHGGAFVSPYDRCHVGMFYTLPLNTVFASIGFRLICVR